MQVYNVIQTLCVLCRGFITGNLFEEELYSTNWHQGFCKTLCGGRITGIRCFYHMKSGVQLYMTKMFNKSKTLNRKDPGSCWCPIKNILAQLISYLDFSILRSVTTLLTLPVYKMMGTVYVNSPN